MNYKYQMKKIEMLSWQLSEINIFEYLNTKITTTKPGIKINK